MESDIKCSAKREKRRKICGSIYLGYNAFLDGEIIAGIIFMAIAVLVIVGGIYETRKMFMNKRDV